MLQPRTRSIYLAIFALTVLMAVTRSQHFGSMVTLPDASLAVFFLGGLLLLPAWSLGILLGVAMLIDVLAIQIGGVSGWCVTPAYGFLLVGYAAMWFGGRWSRNTNVSDFAPLLWTIGWAAAAVTLAFVISNASFYALSGYFTDQTLTEFASAVARYLPSYAGWTLLYVALGWIAVALLGAFRAGEQHSDPAAR